METVGDLSMHLDCQWWFCINIGRIRNKIRTAEYDFICLFSAAPWLMLRCEILILHTLQAEHMNYALSKRNLLLQVLYAFTRFYLYYQDELQMEKCLMEYTLTSLFSILLFPWWDSLVENCLGYIVGLVLRKKRWKIVLQSNVRHVRTFLLSWFQMQSFLYSTEISAVIGYLLFIGSQSIFFSLNKQIKK